VLALASRCRREERSSNDAASSSRVPSWVAAVSISCFQYSPASTVLQAIYTVREGRRERGILFAVTRMCMQIFATAWRLFHPASIPALFLGCAGERKVSVPLVLRGTKGPLQANGTVVLVDSILVQASSNVRLRLDGIYETSGACRRTATASQLLARRWWC
jgi:hypothetical protein